MRPILTSILLALCLFCAPLSGSGQKDTANRVTFPANADLVSRYIWRGLEIGHAPAIQPGMAMQWKNFKLGAWGSYKLTGEGGQETDFYLSKTFGCVSLAVWDYFSFNDTTKVNFFDYKEKTTLHILEAQVLISGGKTLPFNFLASYFFYGWDASRSLYLELQYEHKSKLADLMLFAGYQAKGNYYASGRGFVNIGCTLKKNVAVTEKLSFPVYMSLIVNPASKVPYLVAGITF